MRHLLTFISISFFLLISCTPEVQNGNKIEALIESGKPIIPLPDKYYGTWVSEAYISDLKKTRSTKKAQELIDGNNLIFIRGEQKIMQANLHEGAGEGNLFMHSQFSGTVFSADSMYLIGKIKFNENKLTYFDKQYVRGPQIESDNGLGGLAELVNESFFSGKYKINGAIVEFTSGGSIKNYETFTTYKLNIDYMDAGMQFDKVYLGIKNEKSPQPYIYEFVGDTLKLFEIVCLEKDGDFCLIISKGKMKYSMVKE